MEDEEEDDEEKKISENSHNQKNIISNKKIKLFLSTY